MWKVFEKGQYYFAQSVSINKQIERCFFFSLKTNNKPGADEINFNVIKHCFGKLSGPLEYLFDSSLQRGVVPDLTKITIVSPVFKTCDTAGISNYHQISVLPCFSKILERVMYNHLYKYLADQKRLHPQQFGFRKCHFTHRKCNCLACRSDLQIIWEGQLHRWYFCRLVKGIWYSRSYNTFEKTWDLWNYRWKSCLVRSYLTNRKQYICINNNTKTSEQKVTCGVPQWSILGPLLFLISVNDRPSASNLLNTIMFADDTKLFLNTKT